jgi:hypothetical protein
LKDKQTCKAPPLVWKWPALLTGQSADDGAHPGVLVTYYKAEDPTVSLAKEQLVITAFLSLNKKSKPTPTQTG